MWFLLRLNSSLSRSFLWMAFSFDRFPSFPTKYPILLQINCESFCQAHNVQLANVQLHVFWLPRWPGGFFSSVYCTTRELHQMGTTWIAAADDEARMVAPSSTQDLQRHSALHQQEAIRKILQSVPQSAYTDDNNLKHGPRRILDTSASTPLISPSQHPLFSLPISMMDEHSGNH